MKLKITGITFLGAIFFLFPHLLVAQTVSHSYCSLFDQAKTYENKIVKTNALMSYSNVSRVDGGDTFLYSPNCNNGDYFATIDTFEIKKSSKLRGFFAKLSKEKNFIIEVYFTGKLQTSLTPTFGHLSWARAEMKIFEISSIKDVTEEPKTKKPDNEAETPLISKGSELQSLNSQILFYFVSGDKSLLDIERYTSKDFTLTDKLGRTFDKNNYLKLIEEGLFNRLEVIGVELGRVTKLEDENYVISGKIENRVDGIKKEALNYENNFQFSKEKGWMLTKIKFSEN